MKMNLIMTSRLFPALAAVTLVLIAGCVTYSEPYSEPYPQGAYYYGPPPSGYYYSPEPVYASSPYPSDPSYPPPRYHCHGNVGGGIFGGLLGGLIGAAVGGEVATGVGAVTGAVIGSNTC